MNTRKVIITAAIIATFGMLAFAQQQRQTGNAQARTPQMQVQLQQQDAVCPNGGAFAEDATRTQTRAQAHDPVSAPESRRVQQQPTFRRLLDKQIVFSTSRIKETQYILPFQR